MAVLTELNEVHQNCLQIAEIHKSRMLMVCSDDPALSACMFSCKKKLTFTTLKYKYDINIYTITYRKTLELRKIKSFQFVYGMLLKGSPSRVSSDKHNATHNKTMS